MKQSAIPTVFLQTWPEYYLKNVCCLLFLTNRDKDSLLKLLNVLKQLKSFVGRENEEIRKGLKKLGILLVESELQKARINKKKELLRITAKENKVLKALLRQKVLIDKYVLSFASLNV